MAFFKTWDCSLRTKSRTRKQGPIHTWQEPAGLGREVSKVRKLKPKDFARLRPKINPTKVSAHRPGAIKLVSTEQGLESRYWHKNYFSKQESNSTGAGWHHSHETVEVFTQDIYKPRRGSGSLLHIMEIADEWASSQGPRQVVCRERLWDTLGQQEPREKGSVRHLKLLGQPLGH